jgi:hypothetical protein
MLTSVLSPTRIINPQPMPWDWNPAETFQTAFNESREERRAQQEFDLGMQLEQILLPAKIAKAEYDTKKFAYDSKLLERIYRTQSAALDNSYRGVTSAVGGGQGGGGGGNNTPATNAQGFQSKFGWGSKIATPPQAASRPKPTWQVVAPAQPNPTGP